MDPERFDELIRSVGSGSSRRAALAALSRGALALIPLALDLHGSDAKKRKKKKKRKKLPTPSVPTIGLEPADAATRDAMLSAASQSADYSQLVSYLQQQEQLAPNGTGDVWRVLANQELARTILMTAFGNGGREAVLAYGLDATGAAWTHALLSQGDDLLGILLVGDGGQVELIDSSAAARALKISRTMGIEGVAPVSVNDLCELIGLTCPNIDNPCFQCKLLCKTGIGIAQVVLKVGCKGFGLLLCGSVTGPLFIPCAFGAWAVCHAVVSAVGSATCDAAVCQTLGYCCLDQPEWLHPDHRFCDGRCVDAGGDRNHCGRCNHACLPGDACNDSICLDGDCTVSPKADGTNCDVDKVCMAGQCQSVDGPSRIVVRRIDEHGQPLPGGDYRAYYYDPEHGENGGVGEELDMSDVDDLDDGQRDGVATIFIEPGSYVIAEAGWYNCPIVAYAEPPGKIAHVGPGERVEITIGDYPQGKAIVTVVDGQGQLLRGACVFTESAQPLPLTSWGVSQASNCDGDDNGCDAPAKDGSIPLLGLIEGDHVSWIRIDAQPLPTSFPAFQVAAGQTTEATLQACPDGVAGCVDEWGDVFCGGNCTPNRMRELGHARSKPHEGRQTKRSRARRRRRHHSTRNRAGAHSHPRRNK